MRAERKPLEEIARPLTAQEPAASGGESRPRRRPTLGRYRPGPGQLPASSRMAASTSLDPVDVHREIDILAHALEQDGPTERRALAAHVGARYWGPGVFGHALRAALREGRIRRMPHGLLGPVGEQGKPQPRA